MRNCRTTEDLIFCSTALRLGTRKRMGQRETKCTRLRDSRERAKHNDKAGKIVIKVPALQVQPRRPQLPAGPWMRPGTGEYDEGRLEEELMSGSPKHPLPNSHSVPYLY